MGYNAITRTFDTIADLRLQRGTSNSKVQVLGYYAPGDGGGGEFYWNSSSSITDDLGSVIQTSVGSGDGRWIRVASQNPVSVTAFGAIGNAFFKNPLNNLFQDSAFQIPAADDTVAIQNAINYAVSNSKDIIFDQKHYQITDTINLPGPPSLTNLVVRSLYITGDGTGAFTFLKFKNTIPDKPMWSVASGMTYMVFSDVAFQDVVIGTSYCFLYQSTKLAPAIAPLWKMGYEQFRIENFKVGVHFLGDPNNYLNDTLLDGVTFMHGKFRECRTSVIYENIQAVNHCYYNVDFENGSAADIAQKFKIFHLKRGSVINHYGGSVIGAGPYVYIEVLSTALFQNTSQFNSYGVRMESRQTTTPIIYHAENSTIIFSNTLKVNLNEFSVLNTYEGTDDVVFAKLGGQIALYGKNIRTNKLMYIYAAATVNLANNAQFGNIQIINSAVLQYKKYIPSTVAPFEYGSAGVGALDQTEIPCKISNKVEGAATNAVSGYQILNNTDVEILPTGFNPAGMKCFTWKPTNSGGFGSGSNPATLSVILPRYARPIRFACVKTQSNTASTMILTFNVEIASVQYQSAQINTTGRSGTLESLIIPPAGSLNELYVDGTIWDGKCTITKTGTVNAFQGTIYIYYI